MNMVEAVKSVFGKYATFSGRARRSEYWYFTLFNGIVILVLTALNHFLFGDDGGNKLGAIYLLVTFLPSLAVAVRRLHDVGKPGTYYFMNLIPVIGQIILLVKYVSDSEPGNNAFGPNPKMSGGETDTWTGESGALRRSEPAFSSTTGIRCCPFCGAEIEEGDMFCVGCGKKL